VLRRSLGRGPSCCTAKSRIFFLVLARSQSELGGAGLQYKRDQLLGHSDHSHVHIALTEQGDYTGLYNTENLAILLSGRKPELLEMAKNK